MIQKSAQITQSLAMFGMIDADNYAAATYTSDYGDASVVDRFVATIAVGDMAATATVDAKLVQATDSSGTGKKDITGAAITQLTQAGSDDNKQAKIEVRSEQLDINNGFDHVAVEVTVAAAAVDLAAWLEGLVYSTPASSVDLASVAEIVVTP